MSARTRDAVVVLRLKHKAVEDKVDGLADERAVHHEFACRGLGGRKGCKLVSAMGGVGAGSAAGWRVGRPPAAAAVQAAGQIHATLGNTLPTLSPTVDAVKDGLQIIALPRVLCSGWTGWWVQGNEGGSRVKGVRYHSAHAGLPNDSSPAPSKNKHPPEPKVQQVRHKGVVDAFTSLVNPNPNSKQFSKQPT